MKRCKDCRAWRKIRVNVGLPKRWTCTERELCWKKDHYKPKWWVIIRDFIYERKCKMKKPWFEQKTFWTGVTMFIVAVLPAFTSITTEQVTAIEAALAGLALIFLRQGVESNK